MIQDYEIWNSNTELVDWSYRLPLDKIVVSKYLQDLLRDKFGAESKKIFPGINYNIFHNDNKVFGKGQTILIADHPLENKNVKGALKILRKLKEKYTDLRFKCFGVDRYNEMPEYVEFYKNPDDEELRQLYGNSDIFIYPSLFEGFAATPAEAMACKCAVAANSIGAIPEYSVHGETAMLANPANPTELFEGVCYLLDNPSELKRISLAGHEHIKKILNWDRSVDEFENILRAN